MKELIERINKELTDFAHNREVGHLLRESVNTIERLENEITAATLRIENDGVLMTEMTEQIDIQAGSIEVAQAANVRLAAERDALCAELEKLKLAKTECINQLQENYDYFAKLKQQEPIGYAYAHQDFVGSVIGEKGEWAPSEVPLYLAPGAQQVQEDAKDAARYRALPTLDWYVGPEYATYNDVVVEGEYANYSISKDSLDTEIDKAMLEAAKETNHG